MNITDQIIEVAESFQGFHIGRIKDQSSYLTPEGQLEYYKSEYSRIAKLLNENFKDQIRKLPLRDLLSFDRYEELVDFTRHYFNPISTHRPILFQRTDNKMVVMGPNRQPHVCENYNFARDDEKGKKLADYLLYVYVLLWLRIRIGYDTTQYPEKAHLVAFERDNMVYVRYDDFPNGVRLYYSSTNSDAIMQTYWEIKECRKGNGFIAPLLAELPYYTGQEAQDKFDFEWYRAKKQSPLNYRCFPNIRNVRIVPDPKPDECKWVGEYCIDKDELENRFQRFTRLLEKLQPNEQEEFIVNTMDYFERFIKTDCFEKTIHKKPFEEILSKLKGMRVNSVVQSDVDLLDIKGIVDNDVRLKDRSGKKVSTINFLTGSQKEREALLSFIVENYSGKKGKSIAIMIQALEKNMQIAYHKRTELYAALKNDFGDIGADSGINKFMTTTMREDKEIQKNVELHAEKIKQHSENLPK
ncbi:MAG: hypothetical protein AB7U05_06065 [Mangrovibacterium sp.]